MNTIYNHLAKLFCCCLFPLLAHTLPAQNVDITLNSQLDCKTNTLCVPIELASSSALLEIGTSSILLNYNKQAITFSSYESSSFDGSDKCIASIATAWNVHTYDGTSLPGSFNLTMTLLNNNFSCPSISDNKVEVGVVCFAIKDSNMDPAIRVNTEHTQFNEASTNNGANLTPVGDIDNILSANFIDCTTRGAVTAKVNTSTDYGNQLSIDPTKGSLEQIVTYPNPASNELFVDMQAFTGQEGTLQIRNNTGQLVQKIDLEKIPSNTLSIDLTNIRPGTYIISLQLKDRLLTNKLLIMRE